MKIKLIGRWGGLDESLPVWEIRPDSIFYYDHLTAYSYKILNGDFIIDFHNSKVVLKNISVIKDTMSFLDDQDITTKAYRFTK